MTFYIGALKYLISYLAIFIRMFYSRPRREVSPITHGLSEMKYLALHKTRAMVGVTSLEANIVAIHDTLCLILSSLGRLCCRPRRNGGELPTTTCSRLIWP